MRRIFLFLVMFSALFLASLAEAHHTSVHVYTERFSPPSVLSSPRGVRMFMRWDYLRMEKESPESIAHKTRVIGAEEATYNAFEEALQQAVVLAWNVSARLIVEMEVLSSTRLRNLREGHLHEDGSYGFHVFGDVQGNQDLWVSSTYLLRAGETQTGINAGFKLPVGRTDARTQETFARVLGIGLQPGSGAADQRVGGFLAAALGGKREVAFSAQYTKRGRYAGVRLGDSLDVQVTGVFLSAASDKALMQGGVSAGFTAFGRVKEVHGEHERETPNSGGEVFFLSPLLRLKTPSGFFMEISSRVPVDQNWNSQQQKQRFGFSWTTGVLL